MTSSLEPEFKITDSNIKRVEGVSAGYRVSTLGAVVGPKGPLYSESLSVFVHRYSLRGRTQIPFRRLKIVTKRLPTRSDGSRDTTSPQRQDSLRGTSVARLRSESRRPFGPDRLAKGREGHGRVRRHLPVCNRCRRRSVRRTSLCMRTAFTSHLAYFSRNANEDDVKYSGRLRQG